MRYCGTWRLESAPSAVRGEVGRRFMSYAGGKGGESCEWHGVYDRRERREACQVETYPDAMIDSIAARAVPS
jgi:hypothetical protein